MPSISKKISFILSALCSLVLLTGCLDRRNDGAIDHESANIIDLSYDEFVTKIDNKDSFIVIYASTTCHYCIIFKPIVEEYVAKENIIIYYLYNDTFEPTQYYETKNYIRAEYTPTTNVVIDGKLEYYFEGSVSLSELGNHLGSYLVE
jgi:thioredoxin-related protein